MNDRLQLAEQRLLDALARAHERGWRLIDLQHGFRKIIPVLHLGLLRSADRGIVAWRDERGLADDEATRIADELSRFLDKLPTAIPVTGDGAPAIDRKVLTKVRALLAKAESTDFEPEAEALWAKAHELMARHSIDDAAPDQPAASEVVRRRVLVDEPYVFQRLVLLDEIAIACGCRAIISPNLGLATVFGIAADVDTTEVLYTSMLLQASRAMMTSPSTPVGVSPSTVAAFRRSFLTGFAERIGHRLRALRRAVVEEVQSERGDLLPVLALRESAVDAAVDEYCTSTIRHRRGSSAAGLLAGDRAGQQASLDASTLGARRAEIADGR